MPTKAEITEACQHLWTGDQTQHVRIVTQVLAEINNAELGLKKWRLHAEPDSRLYAKGPHWRVCNDQDCPHQHVWWEPFYPITGQEIDLSHLRPARKAD